MKLEKIIYDKNYFEDQEMCICCGYEFDSFDELYNIVNVISGGTTYICEKCIILIKDDILSYERHKIDKIRKKIKESKLKSFTREQIKVFDQANLLMIKNNRLAKIRDIATKIAKSTTFRVDEIIDILKFLDWEIKEDEHITEENAIDIMKKVNAYGIDYLIELNNLIGGNKKMNSIFSNLPNADDIANAMSKMKKFNGN